MGASEHEGHATGGLLLGRPGGHRPNGPGWNAKPLHGPPGVGKTYFAQAIAGPYGLNVIHIATATS